MRFLKQSTSVDLPIGPFLDSTDGVTAETTLTITQPDIRLKKNGGAWAQKAAAQTLTHEENGYYEVTLDATDTDTLGCLRLAVAETGALPVWEEFMIMPANVWDSLFGADRLQVHVAEMTADIITAAVLASDVTTELQSGLATAAALTTVEGKIDIIDTNVDAVLVDTGTDIPATLATIAGYIDTEVAATLAAVDTEIGAIKTVVDAILDDTGTTGVIVATNNDKTGYAIGVGGVASTAFAAGAITAAALAQDAAREVADEVLDRDIAGGASGGSRNVRNALRALRNRQAIAAGTLTVYQEDDTTSAWTASVTTTAGDPISGIDPA